MAQHTGLHAFDFLLRAQAARCSLIAGRLPEAEVWMSLMAKTMRSDSHIDGMFYQHLQSNAAAQRGDWQQSIEHARTGLAMSMEAGTPFPEAHCRIDLARALIQQDDIEWVEQLHSPTPSDRQWVVVYWNTFVWRRLPLQLLNGDKKGKG